MDALSESGFNPESPFGDVLLGEPGRIEARFSGRSRRWAALACIPAC